MGFAYAIESTSAESPILGKNFNSEKDGDWQIYYEKNGRFYIGTLAKNGYHTTYIDKSCFYEFNKSTGYEIYFMLCYAKAVNARLAESASTDTNTAALKHFVTRTRI